MIRSTTSRYTARIAAVLAIGISAVVMISILSSGVDGESTAEKPAINQPNAKGERKRPARYVVQNGDTLTAISEKTGVSVERLQQLNPNLDPQVLSSGERIRLR